MQPQQRLRLDNEQRLLPGAYHPGQKHQEHSICFGTGGSFYLSPQDDELLTQECVFCDQFGLVSGKVGQRPEQERGSVQFGPGDEAVVQRLKTQAYQPRYEGENPVHSRHYPLVKMIESMLEIVLFL